MQPGSFSTLLEMLAWQAASNPAQIAFTFQGQATTYEQLWFRARQFGAFLLEKGFRQGSNAVLALPNGPDFFTVFYGIQCAGGTAVPLFPSLDPARILQVASACEAACVVMPQMPARDFPLPAFTASQGAGVDPDIPLPGARPDGVAFIQYTSGSTGEPKGVMLTHASLLVNIQQMITGMEITHRDVFVSWLPAYHDMGLILMTMVPFYLGIETHLLPTDLNDIRAWLHAIESRRATFTAAPDFAYRLCIRRMEEGFDVSSLRVALNAAEPVRAQTLREFEEKFGLGGVMTAGYGLAEATVGVSMSQPGQKPAVDEAGFVSVGCPFPGISLKIMEGGQALPAGQVGEIAIQTPARCAGYYHSAEETQHLFTQDGFLSSGDLGYLDESGRLYIVGRKKDAIKHAGRTIAPREVEEIADAAPGVRFSAAIGIDRGRLEGEQVYVFAEVRDGMNPRQHEETALEIVSSLHARLGFRPARVMLLKARAIPRTHNGKLQRVLLKEQYLSSALSSQHLVLFPEM